MPPSFALVSLCLFDLLTHWFIYFKNNSQYQIILLDDLFCGQVNDFERGAHINVVASNVNVSDGRCVCRCVCIVCVCGRC